MPYYPAWVFTCKSHENPNKCSTIQSQSNHTTNPITFQSRNPAIGALGVPNAGAAGNAAPCPSYASPPREAH